MPDSKFNGNRLRISCQDLEQDRAFWRELLTRCTKLRGLPAHSAGGYRNRRFAIIRDAAWITLYRAKLPFPQVGVFLRCTGLAGEAFFTLADLVRLNIEPRLRTELGPDGAMEWGATHRPGTTDIATVLAAPLPWDEVAAEEQIVWIIRVAAAWWNCFASLAGTPEVNKSPQDPTGDRGVRTLDPNLCKDALATNTRKLHCLGKHDEPPASPTWLSSRKANISAAVDCHRTSDSFLTKEDEMLPSLGF